VIQRFMPTSWQVLDVQDAADRPTEAAGDTVAGTPMLLYTQLNGLWDCPGITKAVKHSPMLTQHEFLTHWVSRMPCPTRPSALICSLARLREIDVVARQTPSAQIYVNEFVAMQLHELSVQRGKLAMVQQVSDFDHAGLGLIYPPFYVFAAPWVKMTQRNYPHTASTIDFINPPKFLSALWKLLTPLFDPDTVKKMRVVEPSQADGKLVSALQPMPATSELRFLQLPDSSAASPS
jgi:hypothetical protein